ncbi:MAG TPA: LON peptidase substrate-binding domain-containing protein, partial [Longimicrobiales bacterium]
MAERLTLPVLPLRETVVFPGVAVPISAGRLGTVEAIQAALDGDRQMFAVCQRENVDEAAPEILHPIGTLIRIVQASRVRGGLQLLIQGERRAVGVSYQKKGDMLEAVVRPVDEQQPLDPKDAAFVALDKELRDRSAELGTRRGIPAEALSQLVQGMESPGAFADLVAFYLEVPAQEKQALLEVFSVEDRMRRVLVGVERELLRLEAQQEIQQKVQEELGEKQREILLREQMKANQKELGEEEEGADVDELKSRLAALPLQEEARREVDRELGRLSRTHPQSAEYQVIRTYLETVLELPWGERTEDRIDLGNASVILEEDHYGLEDVKDRVLEFLAVRKLQMERAAEDAAAEEARKAEEARLAAESAGADEEEEEEEETTSPEVTSSPEAEVTQAKARAVGRGPILLFVGP